MPGGHKNSTSVSSLFPLPPSLVAYDTASSAGSSRSRPRSDSISSISSTSSFATTISEFSLSDEHEGQLADYGVHMSEPAVPTLAPPPLLVLEGDASAVRIDDGPFPPTPREHSHIQYAARQRVDDPLRTSCRSFISGEPIRLAAAPAPRHPYYVAMDGRSQSSPPSVIVTKRETMRFSVATPHIVVSPRSPRRSSALSGIVASANARSHPAHPDAALLAEARKLLAEGRAISGIGGLADVRRTQPVPIGERLTRKRSWWSARS